MIAIGYISVFGVFRYFFEPTLVHSFTGMDLNGPNYQNGLPEWTLICGFEYFLFTLLGQSGLYLQQKVINPINMQFI